MSGDSGLLCSLFAPSCHAPTADTLWPTLVHSFLSPLVEPWLLSVAPSVVTSPSTVSPSCLLLRHHCCCSGDCFHSFPPRRLSLSSSLHSIHFLSSDKSPDLISLLLNFLSSGSYTLYFLPSLATSCPPSEGLLTIFTGFSCIYRAENCVRVLNITFEPLKKVQIISE